MFLGNGFIYLLIFQFILLSDGAFVINDSQIYDFMPNVPPMIQTTSVHGITDTPHHNQTQLIELLASIDDETTVCIICREAGCIKLDGDHFHKYQDQDSMQNSLSTFPYNSRQSSDEDINDVYDEPLHNHVHEASRSEPIDVAFMQSYSEPIQDDEIAEQEQEPEQQLAQEDAQYSHSIVEIITNENIKSNHGDVGDDDCLIECGNNNQTSKHCKALYHRKCLSEWITKSSKSLCLICNRKFSKTVLQQCRNQSQTVHETAIASGILVDDIGCYECVSTALWIFLALVIIGGIVGIIYLFIAASLGHIP